MRRTITIAAIVAWALTNAVAAPDVHAAPKKGTVSLGPAGGNVLIGGKAAGRKLPKVVADDSDPDGDDYGDHYGDDDDDDDDGAWTIADQKRQSKLLRVAIDTPYEIFADQGTYVHVAAWRLDGTPAKAASVFVGEVEVGTTDRHGALVFLYPPKSSKKKSAVGASSITVMDAAGRTGSVPFDAYLRTDSFASDHVFVYTDRGVYRPGETVHVRTIAWHLERDYASLRKASLELSLISDSGHVVGGGIRDTDDYGVASMDIEVPVTTELGLYHLEVAFGRERESARLQIRDFEAPLIQIEHTLGRFITADQKGLAFDVGLAPSSGGAMGDATISVSARAGGRERAKIDRDVSGPGPHQILFSVAELAAIKSALSEGDFASLQISVRDDRGRTAKLDREMRYTANPYVAVLETDKDNYTTGDPVEIVAKVSDLDGVPQRNIALVLREDGDAGRQHKAVTDESGTAVFSFVMAAQSTVVALHIDGVDDPVAQVELWWVAPRPMTSHIRDPRIREGEKATVTVRFPTHIVPIEKVVHMDVVDTSGALVTAVLLPVTKTKDGYMATGSFSAPSWGSMLLTFFGLGRDTTMTVTKGSYDDIGLLCEGQNLVVHPNRTLTITLDGEPDQASPGADISMRVKVQDASGTPIKASVGVAGVDRRVLTLKDPLEITPMDQFYNPELRTMSTTGSKILSWPVVSRNWGPAQVDIALPPFPFHEGGSISGYGRYRMSDTSNGYGYGSGSGSAGSVTKKKPQKAMDYDYADDFGGIVGGGGGGGGYYDDDDETYDGSSKPASADPPNPPGEPDNRAGRASPEPRATITIRTSFPDTFLWLPQIEADRSAGALVTATLPDAISEQELIIVASDQRGGVGVLRHRIEVTQPVYAQIDFPEVMRAGEQVDIPVIVYNNTTKADTFGLALKIGSGAEIATSVAVAANDLGVALIRVGAPAPGRDIGYELTVSGAGHVDKVSDTVVVTPDGVANTVTTAGVAAANAPFTTSWTVSTDSTGNEAFLSVAFPSVTTAFLGVAELDRVVSDDPLALASDLVSAVMLLEYARTHDLGSSSLEGLEDLVRAAVSSLARAQWTDGSYSFWRNDHPSPYITAWALEGLLAAKAYGLAVSDDNIARAARYLSKSVHSDGLVGVDDVAFWEGASEAVRTGLTAEVFDVLASVPASLRDKDVQARLDQVADYFATYLAGSDIETLAAARALSGLAKMNRLDEAEARRVIEVLLTKRDRGHWEPSWFHAYAGNIEATVAVIEAMHRIDPTGFAREKRDAIAYVLSTREAWGDWHNERGTAAAIRALVAVGSPPEEIPGTVTVTVDGKAVDTITIDPADPYMSAISLNHISLGQQLSAGEHTVSVSYDGKLAPAVLLGVRTWSSGARSAAAGAITAAVKAPATATVGAAIDVRIDVCRASAAAATAIVIAPSSLVSGDLPLQPADRDRHRAELAGRCRPGPARRDDRRPSRGRSLRAHRSRRARRAGSRTQGLWPRHTVHRGASGDRPVAGDADRYGATRPGRQRGRAPCQPGPSYSWSSSRRPRRSGRADPSPAAGPSSRLPSPPVARPRQRSTAAPSSRSGVVRCTFAARVRRTAAPRSCSTPTGTRPRQRGRLCRASCPSSPACAATIARAWATAAPTTSAREPRS